MDSRGIDLAVAGVFIVVIVSIMAWVLPSIRSSMKRTTSQHTRNEQLLAQMEASQNRAEKILERQEALMSRVEKLIDRAESSFSPK